MGVDSILKIGLYRYITYVGVRIEVGLFFWGSPGAAQLRGNYIRVWLGSIFVTPSHSFEYTVHR
jgi:hypothetical protein